MRSTRKFETYAAGARARDARVDPQSGIDLVWASQTVGLAASETDAIVRWAMQLSNNSTVGKVSYGTEAGLFQKMGVPTVICGPGDIAQAHRPNEFVALEQLAQCEAFMNRILDTGYCDCMSAVRGASDVAIIRDARRRRVHRMQVEPKARLRRPAGFPRCGGYVRVFNERGSLELAPGSPIRAGPAS